VLFRKAGSIGYTSTLFFKSFTGILPYPTRRCIKRYHLAEDMYVEPYLLKLILPRETRELGVNELYCYCKTRSQFSRNVQDNRNLLAEFAFISVLGPYHSLRTSQFSEQNKHIKLTRHIASNTSQARAKLLQCNELNKVPPVFGFVW
jgi:hypothetical protein